MTTDCPVRFYRPPGFGALPEPQVGGDLNRLRDLLSLTDENWVLLLAFLLNCMKPTGPYMMLLVEGEQGSGKSLLCALIKKLIDPSFVEKLRLPKTEHDLMIQASEQRLMVFDNASSVKWDMSDALCSLATGSGFSTRKYYTDNESRSFRYCRPVVINGIGEFANRPDLLERAIQLKLPSMPVEARKTEREIVAEFNELLPGLLGRLFDIVSYALRFFDKVEPPKTIRMADAAQWLVAAEPAAKLPRGTFIQALEAGQVDMMAERAVNDPLAIAIMGVLKGLKLAGKPAVFQGTVGELHLAIHERAGGHDRRLPGTPAHLSTALQRLKPMVANIGIMIEFGTKSRKGRQIQIVMDDDDRRPE